MKKLLILIGISLFITGCSTINVIPPEQSFISNDRTYNHSYDEVWKSAVDWFAESHLTIDKIEKESGLITAKYSLATTKTDLNCGDIQIVGLINPKTIRTARLNVSIKEIDSASSQVRVNFNGQAVITGHDSWDKRYIEENIDCESTGEMEQSIFDYIELELDV